MCKYSCWPKWWNQERQFCVLGNSPAKQLRWAPSLKLLQSVGTSCTSQSQPANPFLLLRSLPLTLPVLDSLSCLLHGWEPWKTSPGHISPAEWWASRDGNDPIKPQIKIDNFSRASQRAIHSLEYRSSLLVTENTWQTWACSLLVYGLKVFQEEWKIFGKILEGSLKSDLVMGTLWKGNNINRLSAEVSKAGFSSTA